MSFCQTRKRSTQSSKVAKRVAGMSVCLLAKRCRKLQILAKYNCERTASEGGPYIPKRKAPASESGRYKPERKAATTEPGCRAKAQHLQKQNISGHGNSGRAFRGRRECLPGNPANENT